MNDNPVASLEDLREHLCQLDDFFAVDLAGRLLLQGTPPIEIMTVCEHALNYIGEKYAKGEYFISGLIMAGEIMSRIIEMLTPKLAGPDAHIGGRGRIMIGTVKGDIHGLGKNMAGGLLSAYGYDVLDLGVDVSCDEFLTECENFCPDIIGLSVLLTNCFPYLEKTIHQLIERRGKQAKPFIFISGASVTAKLQERYGADYYVETAFDTVKLCEKLLR